MNSLDHLRRLSVLHAPPGKPFVLKSGKESDIYVDVRLSALDPQALRSLSHDLYWMISGIRTGARLVAGVVLGGCPLATGISMTSLSESELVDRDGNLVYDCLPVLSSLMVRTEPKAHGTGKLVEGSFEPGDKVVLIEDVVTTGLSSTKAIATLQEAGLIVAGAVCVLDRQEGGKEAFGALGIPFKALFTLSELLGF